MNSHKLFFWVLSAVVALGQLGAMPAFAQDVLELETNAKRVDGKNLKCEITPTNDDDGKLAGLSYICSHLQASSWIPYATLAQPEGAVVYAQDDRDVIKLKLSADFDPRNDGGITLDYLRSGISDSRRQYEMTAVKAGQDWVLRDAESGSELSKLCMKKNSKFLIGTVGIASVEPAESSGECDF